MICLWCLYCFWALVLPFLRSSCKVSTSHNAQPYKQVVIVLKEHRIAFWILYVLRVEFHKEELSHVALIVQVVKNK